MSTELIAELRAKLTKLAGPARLPVLVSLGQALAAEFSRIGPGNPAAKPHLDAAIDAFDEAYGYLAVGDPLRGTVAALLGFQLSARYSAHGGTERDRETGIHVLEEALSFPSLPASLRAIARFSLGQLYLARVMAYLQTGGFARQARSGGTASAEVLADADRATACFQALIDGEPVADEFTTGARTMLELTEAVRAMLGVAGGDLAGLDLNRLVGVFTTLRDFQERARRSGAIGYRLPTADLFSALGTSLASLDPLDRPVAVVQGEQPASEAASPIKRPAPPPPPEPAALRRSLSALLPPPADGREPVWVRAARLLQSETPALDVATTDELVALATMLVERPVTSDEDDSAQRAIDGYLLAVALLLRARAGADGDGDDDRLAGAGELLAAAQRIPLDHPAAIVILRSLGAFLPEAAPLDGPVTAIASRYADRLDRALAAGVADPADLVTLHALRCLCRAAEALAELRRAARTVPTDYPWLAPIRTASQLTESTGR